MIVTTVGFQEGAIRIARAKGIALVQCGPKRHISVILKRSDGSVSEDSADGIMQDLFEKRYSFYELDTDGRERNTVFPMLLEQHANPGAA